LSRCCPQYCSLPRARTRPQAHRTAHFIRLCASLTANCCSIAQLLQRQFISACDHQSDRGVPAARLLPAFLAHFRQLRLHVHGGANGAAADHSTADSGAAAGQPPAVAEAAEAAGGVAAHSDVHDHAAQADSNSAADSADDGGDGGAQRMSISPS